MITAFFIDSAISIFNSGAERDAIYLPLVFILLMIVWSNVNETIVDLFEIKYIAELLLKFRGALLDKRAKLEYRHFEALRWTVFPLPIQKPIGMPYTACR